LIDLTLIRSLLSREAFLGRIEQLADRYRQHIALPWQQTVAGAQRIVIIVYDKELERSLRARIEIFRLATKESGHSWFDVDLSDAFAQWMASEEYREAYFDSPSDLQLKLESEFTDHAAAKIREKLQQPGVDASSVVGVMGVGSLFGFTRVSRVLKSLEPFVSGRLVVFFPGSLERNNFKLLDARDGWNYLAVPITLHASGEF
jgi:hypothetical protein